jgi:hypothetical protein
VCSQGGCTRPLCPSAATMASVKEIAVATTAAKHPTAKTLDNPRCRSPLLTTCPPDERAWLMPFHPDGFSCAYCLW